MRIADLMVSELDHEMPRTRKVLEHVPVEHWEWKADENLRSLGWNANHLAEIVGWAALILQQDEFDIAPVDGPRYETPTIDDPAEIVAAFDRNVATAREAISVASDEKMNEMWSMKMGGETLFTISKGECLRTWVFNHTVHHRGILSVYLRMLGVGITPVYDG